MAVLGSGMSAIALANGRFFLAFLAVVAVEVVVALKVLEMAVWIGSRSFWRSVFNILDDVRRVRGI